MTEHRLLLLKEKIIKTDAVIGLLAEKTIKQNQLREKLQFVFEKFVEKSKETETLHRKVCECIANHEPLKIRVLELETQYSDLEMKYNKFMNTSEVKFQGINEELDALKKKNAELIKTNGELKGPLPIKMRKRSTKGGVHKDEIDLLKTENEMLSLQVDKISRRCDEESREIQRITSLLTETRVPDRNIIQVDAETSWLKDKISKFEIIEEQLKKEMNVSKKERSKFADQLADLRLEKKLLYESNGDLERRLNQNSHRRCDADRLSVPFIETETSDGYSEVRPTEISRLKEKIIKLDVTEQELRKEIKALKDEQEELERSPLKKSCMKRLKHEGCNKKSMETLMNFDEELHLMQADLHEAEYLKDANEELDTSDVESVTDLLREMVDLPVALDRFGYDSCSEIEDCLGFAPAEDRNCKLCASTSLTTTLKMPTSSNQRDKDEPKPIDYRRHKRKALNRKAITKKKNLKADDSSLIRRLRSAITRDVFRGMDRYFRKHFNSLKQFDNKCSCEHKWIQFRRNKKLIRLKVEKLRATKSDTKRKERKSNRMKTIAHRESVQMLKNTKLIPSSEQLANVGNTMSPVRKEKKSQSPKVVRAHERQKTPNHNVNRKTPNSCNLKVLTKQNICTKKAEFEVVSLDSGYTRSEADSLELEAQTSTNFNHDSPESEPKRRCKRQIINSSNINEAKSAGNKKIINSSVSIKSLSNRDTNKSSEKETGEKCTEFNDSACNLYKADGNLNSSRNANVTDRDEGGITSDCTASSGEINFDSPLSPDDQINYDSYTLLSPLCPSPVDGVSIYDQVNPSSFHDASTERNVKLDSEVIHAKPHDDRINFPVTRRNTLLRRLRNRLTNTVHKSERFNCVKRWKRNLAVLRGSSEGTKRLKNDVSFSEVEEEEKEDVAPEDVCVLNTVVKTKPPVRFSYKRPNCAKRAKHIEVMPTKPLVIAKPLPVRKVRKITKAVASNLFKKLLDFGNESVVVDEIVKVFTGQNKKRTARLILSEVCLYASEQIDMTYTPPAPPLTGVQILLLGFMYKLEESCSVPDLLEAFLSAAEKSLLAEINMEHLQKVTRLYTAVCKFKKDLDRMRRMVCDAFYFMGDFAVPFLFTALSSWIEILPLQIHSTGDVLLKVLIQVINLKTCSTPGYNLLPLKNLLKHHYEYPIERWNSDEVFQEVFNSYLGNPTKLNEYAILILCKSHSTIWVLKQIDAHVKKVLEDCESVFLKVKVMTMVTNIAAQFRYDEAVEKTKLRNWLSVCLEGDLPLELRESIQKCTKKL